MKQIFDHVFDYDIGVINNNALNNENYKDFFVYKSEEFARNKTLFEPARSKNFFIHLQTSGISENKCNLINYNIIKNTLFIIPPGMIHQLVSETGQTTGIFAGFTPEFLDMCMGSKKNVYILQFFSALNNPRFLLTDEETDEIYSLLLSFKKIHNQEDLTFKCEMLQYSFGLFIFQLLSTVIKYRKNDMHELTRKEDLLLGFVKELNIHFKEQRSVQFYADSLFITAKHLTKVVKEITGKTCGQMIDEIVMTEAKILLADHSLSIFQVAEILNFSDQFFFSKFFKNQTGLSPSEYKKKF